VQQSQHSVVDLVSARLHKGTLSTARQSRNRSARSVCVELDPAFGPPHAARQRQQAGRTYSSSKVIHGWRGEPSGSSPQPTVNNFGGGAKMLHQQLLFLLNREVEHAGPGRRIPHSNVATFFWRGSLRVPRLVVKEYSEPFACKCKPAETNSYKSFHPARPACLASTKNL
jgi:hypothetical protein